MIPRADALAVLERDSFDLVVVGGGITGAGVALDASSRGYRVALVERRDYAAGTSSGSGFTRWGASLTSSERSSSASRTRPRSKFCR